MSTTETYILAPNFTFHPDTSICLGDIIQSPSDPTKPISSPAPPLPPLEHHLDYDAQLTHQKSHSLSGSIWATFLATATARLGASVSLDVLDRYEMDRLETVYFRKQPTDDDAAARIRDSPRVATAMSSGVFGRKPVYMITALKIARGFRVSSGRTTGVTAEVGAEVPVTPEVGLGAEVAGGRSSDVQVSYRTGEDVDVVFAYQLHAITVKGLRGREVDISVYKPKIAFLDERGAAAEVEVSVYAAGEEDIQAFDEEMDVEVLSASDGNEPCVCIAFNE